MPGITIGASGAREKNSVRDFTPKKFYGRWAVMPVKLIQLYKADQRKAQCILYAAEEKCNRQFIQFVCFLFNFMSVL